MDKAAMLLENLVALHLFRLILTYDEERTVTDRHGTIEVMPVWKFILLPN